MKKLMTATATVTAAVLILGGCAQTGGTATEATAGNNRPSSPAPALSSSAPTPTPTKAAGPSITPFGQTFTYDNGLAVLVGDPQPYEPSSDFVRELTPAPAYVVWDVTIVNHSPEVYEPITFYATVQSDNVEADQVFDSEKLISAPSTPLLPERESKFQIAFGVSNPEDLVLMVRPGFEYERILYQR